MSQTVTHSDNPPDPSKPYCLMNSDGSTASWFATHDEAVQAMNKTTKASYRYSEDEGFGFALTPVQGFEFADDGGVWIDALEAKDFHTEKYGVVPVTVEKLNNLATSVKNNIRGIQLSTDYNHGVDAAKGAKASGTIKDAKVDGNKLLLNIAFTDTAKKEIKDGEWKYFSSDWLDTYTHDDGSKHTDVLLGGGLTNRPVAKGLNPLPVNFSELFEEKEFSTLTSAQRNALPASKFLYIAPDGTKHLPVPDDAHVRNAISRLSQSGTGKVMGESWLTDSLRAKLLTKARAMLNSKSLSEENMNELLKKLAEGLGITFSEDTDETELSEQVITKFGEMQEELKPLRELKATTEQQKSFAELYPEQAAQMEADKKFRIEANSRQFAESMGQLRFGESVGKKDDDGNDVVVATNKGLSALALDEIRDTHKKFSEGTATVEDYDKTLKVILNGGLVEYGEKGTSFSEGAPDDTDAPATGTILEKRNAFAEKVREAQKQGDKEISFAEALPIAAEKYPKMYEDYMTAGRA